MTKIAEGDYTSRKTFRLDPDAAAILAKHQSRYGTENAAINGCLRDLKKMGEKAATDDIFYAGQQTKIDEANGIAKQWKEKYDAKCAELQQLQSALALVGKFLRPPEL